MWKLLLPLVLLRLLLPVLRRVFTGQRIDGPPNCITISCPGGGVFFWWQIGALRRLLELYDLERVPLAGASAGALLAPQPITSDRDPTKTTVCPVAAV